MGMPLSNALALIKHLPERREHVIALGAPEIPFLGQDFTDATGIDIETGVIDYTHVFRALGFSKGVTVVDISDYEGATLWHDLNKPIPDVLRDSADLVFDPGTLEHIFNVPQALANVRAMLRVGGIAAHHNPISGWIDHGFYQFSPCLYHDYYPANGFEAVKSYVAWMDLKNKTESLQPMPYPFTPTRTKQLEGPARWVMYTFARKVADVAETTPLQSRYTQRPGWEDDSVSR